MSVCWLSANQLSCVKMATVALFNSKYGCLARVEQKAHL